LSIKQIENEKSNFSTIEKLDHAMILKKHLEDKLKQLERK